jgi:hypothetical protein
MIDFTGLDFHFKFGFLGMENRDVLELCRILRMHEDFIHSNIISFLSITSKAQENECLSISSHANIMSLSFQQKKRMDILEEKCNIFTIWSLIFVRTLNPLSQILRP